MGWSIAIGSVRGTVIRVHVTFLVFLAWIGVANYLAGGSDAALLALAFILLLFLCVVLHEFGHVFAARRYGVQTPDITLLPIGGVARLERIPEKPGQELVVALAGPAVNVVIAVLLFLTLGGFVIPDAADLEDPRVGLLARLATVNVFLVLFNLIPAFPMDGGRVLRALLAYRLGYARATQIAATVGQGVAFLLGLLGLMAGNPLLLFIAFFVYLGAASEASAVQMREASRCWMIADAMVTRFERLTAISTVEDAVECLIRTTQHDFPVVDEAGRLMGVLTRDDMIKALKEKGPATPVVGVMRRDVPTIEERHGLDEALRLLQEKNAPVVGVTDSAGRLTGLVTRENVGELMMIQAATPKERGGSGMPLQPRPAS